MRKNKRLGLLLITFCLIGALLATSCGGSGTPEEPPATLATELNIYSPSGFLAPSAISEFKAEFGVNVNIDIYPDEDLMLSVIQSNPAKYDLIFPTESQVAQMIRMKLLSQLDLSTIPNLANINPEYLDMAYDPGNAYSIPFSIGTTGIAFNTDHVTESVASWGVLWDKKYAGKISMLDSPKKVIGAALKYLGYSINTREASAFEQAKERLQNQAPLLAGFLNTRETVTGLLSGDIWLAQIGNGDALTLKQAMPQLGFVIPNEGSDYYMNCMAIPSKSPKKHTAEVFANFLLRPQIHALNSNTNHYACPNQAASGSEAMDPQIKANPAIYPPPTTKIKLDSWDIAPGPVNVLYNKTWSDLRRQY